MNDYEEILFKRRDYLKRLIIEKQKALSSAPQGHLVVSSSRGKRQYRVRHSEAGEGERYLNKDQGELVRRLAQKEYDTKLIASLNREIRALERYISCGAGDSSPENIYYKVRENKRDLIKPIRIPDDDYIKAWCNVEYEGKSFKENSPNFISARGERMRSKSEIIIANELAAQGIPYRYEYPLMIPGWGTIHPDFTLLNVRRRKEYIWEHFGKMADPEYVKNSFLSKLGLYSSVGYLPGDRLLMTFESDDIPLDVGHVRVIIARFLT